MNGSTHRVRWSFGEAALPKAWIARVHALADALVAPDACLCWRLGGLLIRLSPTWRPSKARGRPSGDV